MTFAAGQCQADRLSVAVHRGVDLRAPAAARTPEGLAARPPFAPAARKAFFWVSAKMIGALVLANASMAKRCHQCRPLPRIPCQSLRPRKQGRRRIRREVALLLATTDLCLQSP